MELMEKQGDALSLSKGFKQTEVGLIPEDWNLMPFEEFVLNKRGGASIKPSEFCDSGVLVIPKGGVVRGGYLKIKDKDIQYVSESFLNSHIGSSVDQSYLVVVLRDLVPSGPNLGLIVSIPTNETYVLAQGTYAFKTDSLKCDPSFLVHFSNSTPYRKLMQSNMVGSTQVFLRSSALWAINIPLPPTLTEQKAIATALSDVDELIANLDKLITKKKAIKQGAMQQLLTPPHKGGKRLAGFTGEWVEKKLGGYTDLITKGTTPTSLGKAFTTVGVNFIKAESIDKNGKIINDKVAFIDSETHEILGRSKMKANDLLFTIAGVLGRVGVILEENLPANTNQAVAIIRLKKSSDLYVDFFFHILRTKAIEKHIEAISVQGAQANFSLTDVANIPLNIPSEFLEQKAIAQILSDMDVEIEQLETKKAKYQNIKQGMMQELLTGKTRLV